MKFKKPIAVALAAAILCSVVVTVAVNRTSSPMDTGSIFIDSITEKNMSAGASLVQSGLIFTELDDGTYEVGYNYNGNKPSGSVTIPAAVNGRSVTRIAEGGFYGCDKLTEITVPDSVISAGANAFTGTPLLNSQSGPIKYAGKIAVYCDDSVQSVTVKAGTLGLADKLFCNAEKLRAVSLPDSLKNLGSMTFDGCAELTSVNIPSGIGTIGSGVFSGCSALKSVTIPASVTAIGSYAFSDSGITHADLTNVTKIGKGAFENSKLGTNSVTLGRGYVDIGGKAFADTEFYEELGSEKYIGSVFLGCDKDINSIEIKDGTLAIADMALSSCRYLTSVTIPSTVKTIGADAFFNCTKLGSVTIPEGVESIGDNAFRLCSGLISVSLPKSLKSSGHGAFYGCDNVMGVTYPGSLNDMAKIEGGDGYALPYVDTVTLGDESGSVGAVKDLKVTGTTHNTVTLSWSRPNLANSYMVEINENGMWYPVGRTDTNSFTVTDLEQCTEYDFRVFACVHSVRGQSETVSGTTKIAPVTNVKTAPSNTEITLSWALNSNADCYQIDMYKNGSWVKVLKTSSWATTTCKVTGLSTKSKYLFRIYAFNGSEYSSPVTVSAATSDPNELAAVTDLSASSTASSITLSWTKNNAADSYQIDMFKNGEWTFVAKVTGTSYTVSGLSANTNYQFKVFSFKGGKYSSSAGITAATSPNSSGSSGSSSGKPAAVTGLYASAANDRVTLSWDEDSADSYQIDMYKNGSWQYVTRTTGTSYTVSGLAANTNYEFKVFAFKGGNYSSSVKVSATTKSGPSEPPDPETPPDKITAVTGLSATASNNSVTLSWNRNSTADSYQIDMYKDGKWVYVAKTTGTSYTVSGLDAETNYQFKVFALKGSQHSSSVSVNAYTILTSSQGTASSAPTAVTGLSASTTNNSVTLSWNKNSTADSYQIDMYKNGKWVYVTKTTGTSYTVSGLSANTNYQFKVFAFKDSLYSSSAGVTAYTGSAISSGTASGNPTAVTGLTASSGKNSVTLSWDKNSTADSYQIDMYKNGKWIYVAKIAGTAYTVTGLAANTEYKFKVFAFSGSQYSPSASVTASAASVLAPEQYSPAPPYNAASGLSGTYTRLKGIDVSGWQGVIDFNAVKESGVDYVIIKAGGGFSTVDTWETNYANAKKAGLMVGAYWYSFALTLDEGRFEAQRFVEALHGKQLDFPVYFDIEEADQFDKGKSFVSELTETFCGVLEKAGWYTGVYCSTNWFRSHMTDHVKLSRPVWIADYRGGCYYDGAYGMWQYDAAPVSGVEFDCDRNWGYVDYSKYIRENRLNGY